MKFKKLLCLILAGVMLLSTHVFAAEKEVQIELPAYTDTGGDRTSMAEKTIIGLSRYTDVESQELLNQIHFLETLDVIQGFSDGTFRPDAYLTRGECARIFMKLLNETAVKMEPQFYDVLSDHTFADAINTMAKKGIVVGYNGAFRPDDAVTGQEMTIMAVKALYYEDYLKAMGEDDNMYFSLANEIDLLKGVSFASDRKITRENAVQLLCNTLEAPLYTLEFEDNGMITFRKNAEKDLLSEKFDIYRNKGIVYANEIVSLLDGKGLPNGRVTIGEESYDINTVVFNDLIGSLVDYYYYDDGKDEPTVVFMSANKKNEVLTIKAEDLVPGFADYRLHYYDGTRKRNVKIAEVNTVIMNGKLLTEYNSSVFFQPNGTVKVISNDGGNTYDVVIIETFTNMRMNMLTSEDSSMVLTGKYNIPNLKFDLKDTDRTIELYDGSGARIEMEIGVETVYDGDGNGVDVITLPPIPDGSLLSIVADEYDTSSAYKMPAENASYIKIIINDAAVEGTLTSMYTRDGESYLKIDGTEYALASYNFFGETGNAIKNGVNGVFYLDADGKTADWQAADATTGDWEYVYMIRAIKPESEEEALVLRFLNTNGEVERLSCTTKVKINGKRYKDSYLAYGCIEDASTMLANVNGGISQLLKIKRNTENVVTDIQTVLKSLGSPSDADEDQLSRKTRPTTLYAKKTIEYALYNDDTDSGATQYSAPLQLFVVPDTYSGNDDDYGVISKTEWPNEKPKIIELYDVDQYRQPAVGVIYEETKARSLNESGFFMVDSISEGLDEENMPVTILRVCNGEKMVEYFVKEENSDILQIQSGDTTRELQKGDLVFLYGKKNEVTKVTLMFGIDNLPDPATYEPRSGPTNPVPEHEQGFRYEFSEVYARNDRNLILQRGKLTSEKYVREKQRLLYWTTNSAVMHYGAIVYDAADGKKPEVRIATTNDIQEACKYGINKSSKVFVLEGYKEIRQLIVYNGI